MRPRLAATKYVEMTWLRFSRSGSASPLGLPHKEGRGFFQQVTLHLETLDLTAKPRVLLAELGQGAVALAAVDALLAHPVAERVLSAPAVGASLAY
jgi:hypothetical protein